MADLRRAGVAWSRAIEHNPGFAEMHLRALDDPVRLAISIMLGKTERFRQPDQRMGNALIGEMREYDVRRHRAIFQHRPDNITRTTAAKSRPPAQGRFA